LFQALAIGFIDVFLEQQVEQGQLAVAEAFLGRTALFRIKTGG